MGNLCCGPSVRDRQKNNWSKTGIVALREQGLSALPPLTEHASHIKVIDATSNKLFKLPGLQDFLVLQRLTLTNNLLNCLPDGLPLSLKVLILDMNQLESLPPSLGQLPRLERLSLRGNRLRGLPPMTGCTNLQFLNLAFNKLLDLPDLSGCEHCLEELDCRNNAVTAIPPSYGRLARLKTLTLENCAVASVPPEVLLHCGALQTLSLHGCPIDIATLQATEGFGEFETRRRTKYSKGIAGGALMGSKGMDEGVTRQTTRT